MAPQPPQSVLDARFAPGISPVNAVVVGSFAPLHQSTESEQARQTDPAPIGVIVLVSAVPGLTRVSLTSGSLASSSLATCSLAASSLASGSLVRRRACGSTTLSEGGNR